jgi:predicted O-linked N-acetylglucosamine transferase (SPINDLY family)
VSGEAHSHYSDVLSDLGRYREAVESYDRALLLAPDAVEDWCNRGLAFDSLGQREEAISSFDQAIACRPDFTRAYLWRAKVLSELGRYDDALEDVDKALAIEPSLAEAWLDRANVLNQLKRYDEALADYEKALALKSDLAEAWLGRGTALSKLKRYDDAITAYGKALVLKPDLAGAWFSRRHPEEHFTFYSEQVVWLPDCYQSNDAKRSISERKPTRSECSLPETAFVFCCFNNTFKILPEVFDTWMRLLVARDNSVLWLIETNQAAALNLGLEAEKRGISSERLIFASKMPLPDHLARLSNADLFLDTLPYNAHTTASDALWAGVPLVTCLGSTFASRVAASPLNAVGLEELITDSPQALATKLANV